MKVSFAIASLLALVQQVSAGLCTAVQPASYDQAAQDSSLKPAVDVLRKYATATWYTDRGGDSISDVLSKCSGSVPVIVVYGLPSKDCANGYSSSGTNKSPSDYSRWIDSLVSRVGNTEVIYILEPDAVGLLSNNKCAQSAGYEDNLKVAIQKLSKNSNAHIYADVAGWAQQGAAQTILNNLKSSGRLTGIAINTSNYKSIGELNSLCSAYSGATGGLHCVFDTSRNQKGSPSNEWCNAKSAGIGVPPGTATNNALVDYYLWIKVPGESDGLCNDKDRTSDSMRGPDAGQFFKDAFVSLWDKSYFVEQQGMPKIGGNWNSNPTSAPTSSPTSAPTSAPTSSPTSAPTTSAPTTSAPTTSAPTTSTPTTEAPTTSAPTTSTPTTEAFTTAPTNSSTQAPDNSTTEPTTSAPSEEAAVLTDAPEQSSYAATQATTSTTAPVNNVSVQSSGDGSSSNVTLIALASLVGVAAVVAAILAAVVIRKRNMREKDDDMIQRDSRGIVVLARTSRYSEQVL